MDKIKLYKDFIEGKKYQNLISKYESIFEGFVPKEVQSEKEILSDMSDEKKKKIEDVILKHFPEAKDKVDVDVIDKESDDKKDDEDVNEEAGVLLAVTIASLIPAAMEAVGTFTNFLKRKFEINLSEDEIKQIKILNDSIVAYNTILKKGKSEFLGKEYDLHNYLDIIDVINQKSGININSDLIVERSDFENEGEESIGKDTKDEEYYDTPGFGDKDHNEKYSKKEIEKIIKKIKKFRDGLFGSDFGNWLKEKGHQLHHLYTSPIRAVLWTISKFTKKNSWLRNEHNREKLANVLYAITMVSLAGYGIMEGLGALDGVKEVASIILKGTEANLNASEIRKQAITALMKS